MESLFDMRIPKVKPRHSKLNSLKKKVNELGFTLKKNNPSLIEELVRERYSPTKQKLIDDLFEYGLIESKPTKKSNNTTRKIQSVRKKFGEMGFSLKKNNSSLIKIKDIINKYYTPTKGKIINNLLDYKLVEPKKQKKSLKKRKANS
jgi:hypothetical protein